MGSLNTKVYLSPTLTTPFPSLSSNLKERMEGGTASRPESVLIPITLFPATSVRKALGITRSSPSTVKPGVMLTVSEVPLALHTTWFVVPYSLPPSGRRCIFASCVPSLMTLTSMASLNSNTYLSPRVTLPLPSSSSQSIFKSSGLTLSWIVRVWIPTASLP